MAKRWIPGQNRLRPLSDSFALPTPYTSGFVLVADGSQYNSVQMHGDATIDPDGTVHNTGGSSPTGPAGGDLAGTYPNPTLAVIGAATGPIGSATVVPVVTIDTKGRVVALTSAAIVGPFPPNGTAGGDLSGSYPNPTVAKINGNPLGSTTPTSGRVLLADGSTWKGVALSGDATNDGAGVVTLANTAVTPGTYPSPADGTSVPVFTVDAKGRLTATSSTPVSGAGTGSGTMVFPRAWGQIQVRQTIGSTTLDTINLATVTVVGTATAVTDATGTYVNYVTLTTLAAAAGWAGALTDSQIQQAPEFEFVIKTGAGAGDIAAQRIWCAWTTAAALDQADAGVGNTLGFRYSTGAGDTKWQAVSRNAGTGLNTVTDTGVTVVANTRYEFRIDARNAASVKFYINGSLVATLVTTLPVVNTTGGIYVTITNLTAGTARNIRISKVVQEKN